MAINSNGFLIFNKHFQAHFEKLGNIKISLPLSLSKVPFKEQITCKEAVIMKKMDQKYAKFNDLSDEKLVENGLVYSQNLTIRSSEIGFDGKASMATLMSFLQDSLVNHVRMTGKMAEGHVLAITQEMGREDLIWVLSSLQIVVEKYPSWRDVVKVDNWMYPSRKNGLGHGWIIHDHNTGHLVAQATSHFVLINKKSRKLSKFSDKIKHELAPHMTEFCTPILNNNTQKSSQLDVNTADFCRTELKPGWNDLDANQHVNNAKYMNWILESVPGALMEQHELYAMDLKYRKECNKDSILQSLTKIITQNKNEVELEHLLLLENGQNVVEGQTVWRTKDDINK